MFQVLLHLARGLKGQFALVSLFAFLSTGADHMQPLVDRLAINAIVGGGAKPREQTIESLLTSVGLLFLLSPDFSQN